MQATAASGRRPSASCSCGLGFLADHRLEVAHHHRVRMRAGDGADEVIGVGDVGDPVAHRLVHRVLQRAGAGGDRFHLGTEQLHAEDVGGLALDVDGAHVDGAGQAEQRAHGGGGDAVLAGAGFGDDAGLAHAAGQQDLAHAVVGLVAAGVVQLIALEVDLCAAEVLRQAFGEPERGGPADIVLQVVLEVGVEGGVGFGGVVGALDLQDQRHQRFRDEAAAVFSEAAAVVGAGAQAVYARCDVQDGLSLRGAVLDHSRPDCAGRKWPSDHAQCTPSTCLPPADRCPMKSLRDLSHADIALDAGRVWSGGRGGHRFPSGFGTVGAGLTGAGALGGGSRFSSPCGPRKGFGKVPGGRAALAPGGIGGAGFFGFCSVMDRERAVSAQVPTIVGIRWSRA